MEVEHYTWIRNVRFGGIHRVILVLHGIYPVANATNLIIWPFDNSKCFTVCSGENLRSKPLD